MLTYAESTYVNQWGYPTFFGQPFTNPGDLTMTVFKHVKIGGILAESIFGSI